MWRVCEREIDTHGRRFTMLLLGEICACASVCVGMGGVLEEEREGEEGTEQGVLSPTVLSEGVCARVLSLSCGDRNRNDACDDADVSGVSGE